MVYQKIQPIKVIERNLNVKFEFLTLKHNNNFKIICYIYI